MNDDALKSSPRRGFSSAALLKQISITMAVAVMDLAGGVALGYTGIILPSVIDPNSGDIYMNTQQVSLYTSMLFIGCLLGSLVCGPLLIRYGQRASILLVIPLTFVGWLSSYFSYVYWLHLLSRFIVGMFTAIVLGCSSTYIAEIAHFRMRGRLLAISDLARQLGFLLVFLVGSSGLNWRAVGVVCGLVPLIIPCTVLFFLPNSPRWLAVKGRPKEEIMNSLTFFRGEGYDIQAEFDEIQEDVVNKANKKLTAFNQLKMMREKSITKRMILLIYLSVSINFSGATSVANYYSLIFQSANTSISPNMSTVLCGAIKIFGSLLYIALADHLGRRIMAIVFLSLAGISISILGLYFYLNFIHYDTSGISWLPLASLLLFTVFISLSYPVIRTLRSELLPTSVRGLGVNLLFFFTFMGAFVVSVAYPVMAESIGEHWTFWIYFLNCIVMALIMYLFLPETKGKTLEEIAKLFK